MPPYRPEDRACEDHRSQGVEMELELGDDAEVAASSPETPEEISVLRSLALISRRKQS